MIGKNLLDICNYPSSSRNGAKANGVTFIYSRNDGTVTANGLNDGQSSSVFWLTGYILDQRLSFPFPVKLTGLPAGASTSTYCYSGSYIGNSLNGKIVPANNAFSMCIQIAQNYNCNNVVFRPMIVPAYEDDSTDYSPYSMTIKDLTKFATELDGVKAARRYQVDNIGPHIWTKIGRCTMTSTTWSILDVIISMQFSYECPLLVDVTFGKNNQGYPYWTDDRLLAVPLTRPRAFYFNQYAYKVGFKMIDENTMDFYIYTEASISSASFFAILGTSSDNRVIGSTSYSINDFSLDIFATEYTDSDMTKIVNLDMYNVYRDRQYRLSGKCWGSIEQVTPLYTYDIVSWQNAVVYRFFAINSSCEKYIDTYFILRYDGYSIKQKDFGEPVTILYAFDSSVEKNKLTITIDYEALGSTNWICRLTKLSLTEGFIIVDFT